MIEPVMEALTTPVNPLDKAISAMINSAALPKVALSSPPIPSPTLAARCSVAVPIRPAKGMMARQEVTKSAVSFLQAGT